MSNEEKEALYGILYAKFMQYEANIEAIKSELDEETQSRINVKINDFSNKIRKSGSLDLILDTLKPDTLDLP